MIRTTTFLSLFGFYTSKLIPRLSKQFPLILETTSGPTFTTAFYGRLKLLIVQPQLFCFTLDISMQMRGSRAFNATLWCILEMPPMTPPAPYMIGVPFLYKWYKLYVRSKLYLEAKDVQRYLYSFYVYSFPQLLSSDLWNLFQSDSFQDL